MPLMFAQLRNVTALHLSMKYGGQQQLHVWTILHEGFACVNGT